MWRYAVEHTVRQSIADLSYVYKDTNTLKKMLHANTSIRRFKLRSAVYANSYFEWCPCTLLFQLYHPCWGKIMLTAHICPTSMWNFLPLRQAVDFQQAANMVGRKAELVYIKKLIEKRDVWCTVSGRVNRDYLEMCSNKEVCFFNTNSINQSI